MNMDVHTYYNLMLVFLTMIKVATNQICVKDFVSSETGEWKSLDLFLLFIKFSATDLNLKGDDPQEYKATLNHHKNKSQYTPIHYDQMSTCGVFIPQDKKKCTYVKTR